VARWWWLPPNNTDCVVFDAKRLRGCTGVVSGQNYMAGAEGDNSSSSGWWDKVPGVEMAGFGSKSSRNVSGSMPGCVGVQSEVKSSWGHMKMRRFTSISM